MILRLFCANGRKFTAHTINALAKLLDIIIGFQVLCNLGIAGEMGMAYVIDTDDARQFARRFKHKAVVEHFDLYLCALNTVIAVAN